MLKQSEITSEELLEQIENEWEDESSSSNDWEYKYNLENIKELLPKSHVIIDNIAFMYLADGLYAIDFEKETSPVLEEFELFEIDSIYKLSRETFLNLIQQKEKEIRQLTLLSYLL